MATNGVVNFNHAAERTGRVADDYSDLLPLVDNARSHLGAADVLLARRTPGGFEIVARSGEVSGDPAHATILLNVDAAAQAAVSATPGRFDANGSHLIVLENDIHGVLYRLVAVGPWGRTWSAKAEAMALSLQPWIRSFLGLWSRHRVDEQRRVQCAAVMDRLGVGIMILDADGAIVLANRCATDLLEAGDGLRRLGGSISAVSIEDTVRLQVVIKHALASGDETAPGDVARVVMLPRQNGRPLLVTAMKIASAACGSDCVGVYIVDPDIDIERQGEPVCRLYGLTPSEARLARLLAAGATLADAAGRLRIRPDTARTYLRAIFSKTGVHRQSELTHIVLTSLLPTTRHVSAVSVLPL